MSDLPACCRTGYQWQGEPKGSIHTIANLQTYVVTPQDFRLKAGEGSISTLKDAENGKVVVILTDVFGLGIKNPKLIADE
jgi:hypothetical protein